MFSRHQGTGSPERETSDQRVPRKRSIEETGACGDHNADPDVSKKRRGAEAEPYPDEDCPWTLYRMEQEELHKLRSTAFYLLLENNVIQGFLRQDTCQRISDKYLLAMVFCYFQRAGLLHIEYTPMNFFIALFLAGNMEEDLPFRENIYPWALGMTWRYLRTYFHRMQRTLWARMGYNARVTREECEQIMSENPNHWAWQCQRLEHHGWTIRNHARNKEEFLLLVPGFPPPLCLLCRENSTEQHQPAQSQEVTNNIVLSSAASPEDDDSDIDLVN